MEIIPIKRLWTAVFAFALYATNLSATDIHVTTTGDDNNAGTEAAPLLTIHKAIEKVQAGDRILIHEGTYTISERIKIPALPTTAERRCEMRAWPEDAVGKVIIDGSAMNHTTMSDFKMGRCIYVNHEANYWTFYGLVLQNAEDNGMKVEGSYNIIERCVFRWNNDTGLQIGMYKDFSIEETKSLPISGTPQFNPGYTYCRYNKVINCDAYENYDGRTYNGTDDGGDADGFACKLFPGPGTEFHGCRAWTNSDDNWDLYMVYHPVVIDRCWAWHAGYTPAGKEIGNGNGFKLGGGGSSGGAAFDQSVGAHVVTNCVAFGNLHKGFDQNNAYEGMYIINCVGWGNEYNYRFPTLFKYGGMTIRNSIGWGASKQNHEFLSEDKTGSQVPDTDHNSWTTLDGCNPYKEGQKVADGSKPLTKDYSGEFLSLSADDFKAPREADGSLPNNGFARLKSGSIFKDKGIPFLGFTPTRKMTPAECSSAGLEYITADDIYIPYNDSAPEYGAFELDGTPTEYIIPEKIELTCTTANSMQEVVRGQPIENIVYEWNEAGTNAVVENLPDGLSYSTSGNMLTISGTPTSGGTFKITVSGNEAAGIKAVSTTGIITLVIPYRVLTGDWYHFQDEADALPADLKDVIEIVNGSDSSHPSSISPTYTENNNVIPGGCTIGAFVMGRSNGGIRWIFKDGVTQLLINLHFTGGRTFRINYTLADGTSKTVNISKQAKGTYCNWDVLQQAGITDGTQLRSIELLNTNSSGEIRIYDMYIRVPDTASEDKRYTLNVTVSPVGAGTVLASPEAESYQLGQRITLTQQPAEGYIFTGWQTAEGKTLSSTDSYTFTIWTDTGIKACYISEQSLVMNDYIVVGNIGELRTAIRQVNSAASPQRRYIFLKNGDYDYGEYHNPESGADPNGRDTIKADNISIIGQSTDNVIIRIRPTQASVSRTAPIVITGTGTYLQDFTLQNDYSYSGTDGQAAALMDKGHHTIGKNMRLLSRQDTYYSNTDYGQLYFEDSEFQGTVDYICGRGDVFFNRCVLKNLNRYPDKGDYKGDTHIAAPYTIVEDFNAAGGHGYIFMDCHVDCKAQTWDFGRGWRGWPKLAFLNTTLSDDAVVRLGNDQTSGKPADLTKRATTKGIQTSSDSQALQFFEYNTKNQQGTVISPESNVMTFTASDSKSYETILQPSETERFQLRNVYHDWTPDEDCRQVEVTDCSREGNILKWQARLKVKAAIEREQSDARIGSAEREQARPEVKAFLIECDGTFVDIVDGTVNSYTLTSPNGSSASYTVRAANAMGGFGPAATAADTTTQISHIQASDGQRSTVNGQRSKYMQDGRIVIERDNVTYNTTGQSIHTNK